MLYQIVHSTLGRCRVRVPRLARDARLVEALEQLVLSLEFVTEVRINAPACSLIVGYRSRRIGLELAEEKLCLTIEQAIEKLRSEAELNGNAYEPEEDLIPLENQWKDLGMPALSLSLALLAAPLEIPPLLVGTAIAGAAMPWFVRAGDSIKNQGHANIDLLDSLWMSLQALRGQFVAPALKTVLVEVRRTLRGTVTDARETQAAVLLRALQESAPLKVERNGQMHHLSIDQVQVGDRLLVEVGQTVPVDGFVVQGTGLLDYQVLTGKPTPIPCGEAQEVYALAVVQSGELWIQVTRTGDSTRIGLAARLMEFGPVHDTEIGAAQAEFVKQAILPTVLLGGVIFATTGNIGAAISPYQFDFGSGIPITISTTILAALTHAARYGIYIRSGRALELLSQLDVVVFDQSVLDSRSSANGYTNGSVNGHTNGSATPRVSADRLAAIAELHRQGIITYLLASSSAEINAGSASAAAAIAQQCQISADHILHDEAQQAHLIYGLRHQQKTVAVIGAAPHLACADLTIAIMPQGDVMQSHADVVLLTPDLQGLHDAVAIAKRAMEVLYQNTALITVPNLFMQIGGGMVLGVHPVYNVIVNNSSAILAEFLNGNHPHFDTVAPVARSLSRKFHAPLAALPASSLSPMPAVPSAAAPLTLEVKAIPVTLNSSQLQSQNGLPALPLPTQPIALRQGELAKRLGVTCQALTRYRSRPDFGAWSRDRDPQGKAWIFNAQTRYFLQA